MRYEKNSNLQRINPPLSIQYPACLIPLPLSLRFPRPLLIL